MFSSILPLNKAGIDRRTRGGGWFSCLTISCVHLAVLPLQLHKVERHARRRRRRIDMETPCRTAKPEPRMTFWRSFLDLCCRLVIDTQEPMSAAHANHNHHHSAHTVYLARKETELHLAELAHTTPREGYICINIY